MKISKRTKSSVTALAVILLSICGYLYCRANTLPAEGEIGSMYTPKLLCLCLLVLGAVKLLFALRENAAAEEIKVDKKKLVTGVCTIVLIGLYCILFKSLGFVIVTFCYLVGQMALFFPQPKRRWGQIVLIAFLTTTAAYLIFSVAFNLILPLGPLKNVLTL